MEKDIKANSDSGKDMTQESTMKRRTLLKALVGIPVLGVFAFELFKKWSYDHE
jgi:hypothetical protein